MYMVVNSSTHQPITAPFDRCDYDRIGKMVYARMLEEQCKWKYLLVDADTGKVIEGIEIYN